MKLILLIMSLFLTFNSYPRFSGGAGRSFSPAASRTFDNRNLERNLNEYEDAPFATGAIAEVGTAPSVPSTTSTPTSCNMDADCGSDLYYCTEDGVCKLIGDQST